MSDVKLMDDVLKSSGMVKVLSVAMLTLLTACASLSNTKQTNSTDLMSITAKQTGVYHILR